MGWKFLRSSSAAPEAAGETSPGAQQHAKAESKADEVVKGFYRCREKLVSGWIVDVKDPDRKHDVEIFVGGRSIGTVRADRYDALVQSHHGGDGNYAFAFYYDTDLNGGPVEATVVDCESKTQLRSKLPMLKPTARTGPPLSIETVRIGEKVELTGRIGAYPLTDAVLEIWCGERRVASSIPVVANEADGTFSAVLEDDALCQVLSGGVELALPGLHEAGLGTTLEKAPVTIVVSPESEDRFQLELRGNFEQTQPFDAVMSFVTGDKVVDETVSIHSKAASVRVPRGFDLDQGSVRASIAGMDVPVRLEWPLLHDVQFREVGETSSRWQVSDNAVIDRGFFAFPQALADEHELSGHTVHVSLAGEEGPVRLFQVAHDLPANHHGTSVSLFARTAKNAALKARLRDDTGVLSECSAKPRSSDAWNLLQVQLDDHQPVSGQLIFEVEASGRSVKDLAVALGASRLIEEVSIEASGPNLVANGGFSDWPNGAGTLQHISTGEPCAGWRLANRRSKEPVFTRAVTHPSDGSLGLALAAPTIPRYLRLEADVTKDVAGEPLLLRFRAGMPASARQLLAHEAEPVPQFTIIDPIQIIRRIRITTPDTFIERESVVDVFTRRLPISQEIESYEFSVPALPEPPDDPTEEATEVEETYHLAFEFRNPAVIALFDVELVALEPEGRSHKPPLQVEDRNIELQIETLQTVAHWSGPTPVRLATRERKAEPKPLKWGTGPVRDPVTIVIPVFNALPETLACLDSLNGSTTVPILVSVVDDASDPPVRDALFDYAKDKPWVRVQSFARNRGYTYAADHGVRDARTEWVVLLNSDTIVTRGWLEGMLDCARSDPEVAFVGPVSNAASYQSVPELYDASRKWKVNRLPPGVSPEDMAEIVRRVSLKACPKVPLLNGFCTLMKRSVFVELGGLNATAFPAGYGEENDLCLRARKAGIKLAVADDVYVYHVKSASFGDARRKELTKGGNSALKKLHPNVDIGKLTERFRETPALVALRKSVASELEKLHGPIEAELPTPASDPASGKSGASNRQTQLQKA